MNAKKPETANVCHTWGSGRDLKLISEIIVRMFSFKFLFLGQERMAELIHLCDDTLT